MSKEQKQQDPMDDAENGGQNGAEGADQASEAQQPADPVAAAQQEAAAFKDRWLRAEAEADNVRKRGQRELDEYRKYAEVPLIRELLPVVDNVARTVEAAEKQGADAAVLEGFKLVAKQFEDVLAKRGCTRVHALHQPFDPHKHEAVMQQPSSDFPPMTVLSVMREGFVLHDRVIRPAQVIVSKEE